MSGSAEEEGFGNEGGESGVFLVGRETIINNKNNNLEGSKRERRRHAQMETRHRGFFGTAAAS